MKIDPQNRSKKRIFLKETLKLRLFSIDSNSVHTLYRRVHFTKWI